MLEKVKEFIPDLIVIDHYKQPSIYMKGTTEYLMIHIEGYLYEISTKKFYDKNLKRRFYIYEFSGELDNYSTFLYLGYNFNELIHAIKEEMKRRENEFNS